MSDLFLTLLVVAVVAGVLALIALPFVYVRGMKQIDAAMDELWEDREQRASVSNVRVLSRWELARRMERNRRRGGGDAA